MSLVYSRPMPPSQGHFSDHYSLCISQLPNNPNATSNWVPEGAELASLRNMAVQSQRVVNQLTEALIERATYEDVKGRHEVQIPALQSIRSEPYVVKELAESWEKTAASLEPEVQQLRRLRHPIHRYPDDHMRLIFEECVKGSNVPPITAACLSHVCRRWRQLALTTPRLWNVAKFTRPSHMKGNFNSKAVQERLKSKAEAFVSRVGNVPAEITIEINVNYILSRWSVAMAIKSIPFDVIYSTPVISTLVFDIYHYRTDPSFVFDAIDHFPRGNVAHLSIRMHTRKLAKSFHPGLFLSKFSGIRVLNLRLGTFSLPISPAVGQMLTNIHVIDFSGLIDVPIIQMLRLMHGTIQSLTLGDHCHLVLSSDAHAECYVMPKLSSLCVDHSPEFPWNQIQCPNLTHLEVPYITADLEGELFWGFCARTKSITSVDIKSGYVRALRQFRELAQNISQLRRLYMKYARDSDMTLVSTGWQEAGLEGPPFPALLHLHLWWPHDTLRAETLDAVIRSRCLSRDHPASIMDTGIAHALEGFEITGKPGQQFDWKKSPYLSVYFRKLETRVADRGGELSYQFLGENHLR